MLEVEFPSDMKQYVGQKVGSSDWLTVDQKRIDDFAAARNVSIARASVCLDSFSPRALTATGRCA